jgi:hypothetical protein
VEQARLAADKAAQAKVVAEREARAAWSRAEADLAHLYDQVEAWRAGEPIARDAWLHAQSLYRGGDASGLEVIDAFDDWSQAGLDRIQATLDFRLAQARLQRWEAP